MLIIMKTIVDINNLNLQNYYSLWEEFWFNKLGYLQDMKEKIAKIQTVEQARKDDEILEKEFVEFYNNKINK
jgi:hypothetical protein